MGASAWSNIWCLRTHIFRAVWEKRGPEYWRTLTPDLPQGVPWLLLPTVHKPQGSLLVGSSPKFRDSVTLDVPATLLDKPITEASCPV